MGHFHWPFIVVNRTGMSWQHVYLPLKTYVVVEFDNQDVVWCRCRVMLVMVLPRRCWSWRDVTVESCWWRCCQVIPTMALLRQFGCGVMSLPSLAGDCAIESCWQGCCQGDLAMTRCCCWVMLATVLPRRLGHGVMSLLSHAGGGAAKVIWPWYDVAAESCWWRWCRVTLTMALLSYPILLTKTNHSLLVCPGSFIPQTWTYRVHR
jgi:hypothetical protein